MNRLTTPFDARMLADEYDLYNRRDLISYGAERVVTNVMADAGEDRVFTLQSYIRLILMDVLVDLETP